MSCQFLKYLHIAVVSGGVEKAKGLGINNPIITAGISTFLRSNLVYTFKYWGDQTTYHFIHNFSP